jgi:hypothetical protein
VATRTTTASRPSFENQMKISHAELAALLIQPARCAWEPKQPTGWRPWPPIRQSRHTPKPRQRPLQTKVVKPKKNNGNGAKLGFEARLFLAADKLRKNLEPSDYKHVALGLIFLKYISNAFEAKRAALLAEDPTTAEDPDEYLAENVFWVPKEARWSPICKATPSSRPSAN